MKKIVVFILLVAISFTVPPVKKAKGEVVATLTVGVLGGFFIYALNKIQGPKKVMKKLEELRNNIDKNNCIESHGVEKVCEGDIVVLDKYRRMKDWSKSPFTPKALVYSVDREDRTVKIAYPGVKQDFIELMDGDKFFIMFPDKVGLYKRTLDVDTLLSRFQVEVTAGEIVAGKILTIKANVLRELEERSGWSERIYDAKTVAFSGGAEFRIMSVTDKEVIMEILPKYSAGVGALVSSTIDDIQMFISEGYANLR